MSKFTGRRERAQFTVRLSCECLERRHLIFPINVRAERQERCTLSLFTGHKHSLSVINATVILQQETSAPALTDRVKSNGAAETRHTQNKQNRASFAGSQCATAPDLRAHDYLSIFLSAGHNCQDFKNWSCSTLNVQMLPRFKKNCLY